MRKTAALTLVFALAMAPALFSQMGRGMMADDPLQLTSEQMTKIRQMNLNYQKELVPMRMKLQEKCLELTALMAERDDPKKIDAKIEEISAVYADLLKRSVEHRSRVQDLLSDEQKEMFSWNTASGMGMGPGMMGMMGQGMGMMRGMRGNMMGGMGPWRCPYCGMWCW